MNTREYMTNPMGKGSSAMLLSEVRNSLNMQFNHLYPKMAHKKYMFDDDFLYYIISIPSRTIKDIVYTVVVEYDLRKKGNHILLDDLPIRAYSNCPTFTFTFAKVFNDADLIIPWLKGKYEKEVLTKEPVIKNPNNIINYERSLYIALKYISMNGRNIIAKAIDRSSTSHKKSTIESAITSASSIVKRYQLFKRDMQEQMLKKKYLDLKAAGAIKKPHSNGLNKSKMARANNKMVRINKTKTSKVSKVKKI